jgi:hypothetical protein
MNVVTRLIRYTAASNEILSGKIQLASQWESISLPHRKLYQEADHDERPEAESESVGEDLISKVRRSL